MTRTVYVFAAGSDPVSTASSAGGSLDHPDTIIPSIEVDPIPSSTESSSRAGTAPIMTPSEISSRTGTAPIMTSSETSSRTESAPIRTPSSTVSQTPSPSTPRQTPATPQYGTPTPTGSRSDSIASRIGDMNLATPQSSLGLSEVAAAIGSVENELDERTPGSRLRSPDLQTPSPGRHAMGRSRSRSASVVPQPRYNGEDEELPPHRVHDPAVQQGFQDAKALMTSLAGVLGSGPLHRNSSSTIHRLHKQAKALANFQCRPTRTVGFVGESGVGKSSLLNALLDHKDLARASGNGAACTCVVTEYHYQDRDDFAIDVEVFKVEELEEQVTDLLKTYRHYRLHAKDMEDAEKEHAKKGAKTAIDTFQAMFRGRLSNVEFLHTEPEDFVRSTLHTWIADRMPQQSAEPETCADLESCSDRLAQLTSELESDPESAIWPYIRKIKVFLKSRILGKGLILADLPGLGDLNSARQAITVRYLVNCDEIFAVCDIGRATTDAKVTDVFELAQRARLSDVGIICTRSDAIVPEEAKKDLKGPTAERVQRLMNGVTAKKGKLHRINGDIDELDEWPLDDLDEQERQRKDHLEREARNIRRALKQDDIELHTIVIEDRNARVLKELQSSYRTRFPGIRSTFFCTSKKYYWDHREYPKDKALPMLRLSGILAVRTHCLSMVADNQLRLITNYIRDDIPAFLGDVALWIESGAGNADWEQKRAFREALDNAESGLQTALRGHDSLINGTRENMKDTFDSQLYNIRRISQWTNGAIEAADIWNEWYHTTYSTFCRHYGDHCTEAAGAHNWNEEAIKTMVSDLENPWEGLCEALNRQHHDVVTLIRDVLSGAVKEIQQGQSSESTATLSRTLAARENVFAAEIEDLGAKFEDELSDLRVQALTGLRISLIGRAMEDSYKACNRESGRGSDRRRKTIINSTLARQELFKKLMRDFRTEFHKIVDRYQVDLDKIIEAQLADINSTLDMARSQNVATESEENPELRDLVAAEVETAEAAVQRIQGAFNA